VLIDEIDACTVSVREGKMGVDRAASVSQPALAEALRLFATEAISFRDAARILGAADNLIAVMRSEPRYDLRVAPKTKSDTIRNR
jgi:hypothetical protein